MFSFVSRSAWRAAATRSHRALMPRMLANSSSGGDVDKLNNYNNKNANKFTVNSSAAAAAANPSATNNFAHAQHNANAKASPAFAFAFVDGVDYQLIVGNEFGRVVRSFSPQDVGTFVSLIHDTNPIHSDASFAASTRFKKPIVPGMLVSSLFSNLLGSKIAGTIYVSQQLRFVRPIYVDETATAVVTISAIDRKFVTLETRVYNHQQEVAVEGDAVVYVPTIRGAKN